ncbi:MAG: trigger factor [Patescibacteria group bacterium]
MQVNKKDLEKSQIELTVELSAEEFAPYIEKGAQKVAEEVKIEGFRKGKVPMEILKQKIGEMTILEEAANIAIHKTIDNAVEEHTMERQAIGQPQVNITKLAPGNPFEYKVIVSILPTIALGKYKDLNLKVEDAKIDDKEVEKALSELQEMRAQEILVEREARDKDKVTVDVNMSLDKVPLEDGSHKELAIILGKNFFVPGFDSNIIGAKAGEEREFKLAYPDDHHQKNIAGKMVEFKVNIKNVYERQAPELNDEFAAFFQLKDMEELKKNLKESLLHEKKHSVDLRNESELISKIVDDTKFGDLPSVIIESESRNMLMELEQNVTRQGGKFEDYLSHVKKTKEQLILDLLPNAVKRVKSALVIREIAVIEKIEVTHEDIHDKIDELEKQYAGNQEILKMLHEEGYHTYLSNILTNEKIIAKLKEWNYAPTSDKQKS